MIPRRAQHVDSPDAIRRQAGEIAEPLDRLRYLRAIEPDRAAGVQRWRFVAPALFVALGISTVATLRAWRTTSPPAPALPRAASVRLVDDAVVRLIESNTSEEQYSNGLRIDNRWATTNRPRSYSVFDAALADPRPAAQRTDPAGIVLHTTESDQVAFEPAQNRTLQAISESLLAYVRRRRAYNFLIDRFGRVHRIVRETDAANHAGHSIWADKRWLYLNLNDSFLGVSFEAQTRSGEIRTPITPAQVHAGALLIAMLRSRYSLAAENCVTHAQVSVNPSNRRIGYHTDWAANFPFEEMGLPDNYSLALPGLYLCGFEYDGAYVASTGRRIESALALSDQRLSTAAAARHMDISHYRTYLQLEYRKRTAARTARVPQGDES